MRVNRFKKKLFALFLRLSNYELSNKVTKKRAKNEIPQTGKQNQQKIFGRIYSRYTGESYDYVKP